MATLFLNSTLKTPYLKLLFGVLISIVSFTITADNFNLKEACFRLEGVQMPCSGGAGCGERCDSSRQAELCRTGPDGNASGGRSYQICGNLGEGAKYCSGTKCCETCEGMSSKYDKCTLVKACGETCTNKGTKSGPDCSKSSCSHYVLEPGIIYEKECWYEEQTGPDRFTCSGNCSGDGCTKSCSVVGVNQCQAVGTCACNLTCQSGIIPGQTTRVRKCNPTKTKNVMCWVRKTIPRVDNGNCGCKCPDNAVTSPGGSEPLCGSTVTKEIDPP
ncbi:MAG: hypothetical protein KDD61_18420 [Bdellovibrionales bacterium]|nr:hypothetical protein [Bdellovibrionales bacterium]